ncbi:hypothetical protein UYSO10_2040 [Kosakonia radicincitans]|nr:hypothetical protein UYSO10_2040 [Kosakonia radicincitans]
MSSSKPEQVTFPAFLCAKSALLYMMTKSSSLLHNPFTMRVYY